jgi:SAM-dependent methyltransferase
VNDDRFATAFGRAAVAYERGRPGYPAAAIDALVRHLGLDRRSVAVDLGAGTGKLTRDLTRRFERVIAVEPLAELRQLLVVKAAAAEALDGSAEELPLPDACADAIFVAQAFHWFDGARALAEMGRVLRPGGGLALLWNTTPWERREGAWYAWLDDLLERSRADLSAVRRHATGRWRDAFEHQQPFEALAGATFDNTQRMTEEDFLANLASRSYVAQLNPDARRELIGEITDLLRRPGAPIEAGHVLVPMRTDTYWTRRGRRET